jgi:hypothetical protein
MRTLSDAESWAVAVVLTPHCFDLVPRKLAMNAVLGDG